MNIIVEDLHFSYPGKDVLKGIDLCLEETEIMCIIGPNGSGKSTLVKCIEDLLKPQQGRILLGGTDSRKLSSLDIARIIGYVPQISKQIFSTTVFDAVLMGRKPHSSWRSSSEDIDVVIEILITMDLADIALQEFNNLSGGQQQRVLIARALAQKPKVLLLDEPTSALDIAHQLEVMEIIHNLVHKQRIAVLMVVHDLNLASRYADKIVMLDDGKIHTSGTAEKTLTCRNIEKVYGVEVDISGHTGKLAVTPIRRVNQRGLGMKQKGFLKDSSVSSSCSAGSKGCLFNSNRAYVKKY
ncbi:MULTISPECIES: ABC transporter ATP-binding protein [unclassified Oceanispirochaeta]|uniref:ABC transporter ATP-binding protein n=1 Tax=unclassified Oceanispirochaeta TaxID=2635722 RepID=UPI000E0954BD|nr:MULTISPECIES: ABC transporter ATP-binding protein [unclassified Oceanispirochaeta]MBF9016520.1 ABC transporter ATP-binding protein [Oceanispirochaeta sp. M2]NPD72982.1 ABC transporter ATP-binding protein [Oceanispirochaeta sp. M1]RDG31326.1 ABC transporter ATP-binding protein [Oceanispirochaeta sp. M1]